MKKLFSFIFALMFLLVVTINTVYADTITRFNILPDVQKENVILYHFNLDGTDYYKAIFFDGSTVLFDSASDELYLPSSCDRYVYDESSYVWQLEYEDYGNCIPLWEDYGCSFVYSTVDVLAYGSYSLVFENNIDSYDSLFGNMNDTEFEEDDDSGFWSSLFNRLTDGFSAIVDALINIFNKMIEVVQNVIDVILGIPQAILDGLSNLFEYLFVPVSSRNLFDEVKTLFESKFGIFNQFRDLVESILSPKFYDGTPKFEITYKGSKYEIIDFGIISPYRTFIINLTGFLMIFSTILWLIKNAATIIHNGSASSDTVKE